MCPARGAGNHSPNSDPNILIHTLNLKGNGLGARFLPDGTLMGVNAAGLLQMWDVQTGQPTRKEFVPRNTAPNCANATVHSFDASDDGSILAVSLSCGFGVVWKMGDPKVLFAAFNYQDEMRLRRKKTPTTSRIALSPDGKMAAYGTVYAPNPNLILLDIMDVEKEQILAGVTRSIST